MLSQGIGYLWWKKGKCTDRPGGALLLIPANESGEQNPHLERGSAGSCCQGEEPELNFIILSITSWSWRGDEFSGSVSAIFGSLSREIMNRSRKSIVCSPGICTLKIMLANW